MHGFGIVLALVVGATVVTAFAERFRAPAPSLLVVAGLGVGLLPGVGAVEADPHLVAVGVLPPLLYAGASDVALPELRKVIGQVSALAVGLVGVSALAIAYATHALFPQVRLAEGFVLGAVLASTDPIAVGALARRLQLPPRLLALVQGESLLNDATSLVLFKVAVGVATAGAGVSLLDAGGKFLRLGLGGAVVGIVVGLVGARLRRRVHDPVIETIVVLVLPYSAYVGAEGIGTSGVTAVVLLGLTMSEVRTLAMSTGTTRLQIANVYAVVQFLLESVIFAIIGLQLPTLVRRLHGDDRDYLAGAAAIVVVVLVVRVLWVYPATYLPAVLRRDRDGPGWQVPTVITWAGTRGVVPLAAALSIPLTVPGGGPFPHRDLLLVLTTCCILVTLVGQGLTLAPLVARLGVQEDPETARLGDARAACALARSALVRLEELVDLEAVPESAAARLRPELQHRLELAEAVLDGAGPDGGTPEVLDADVAYGLLRRELLRAEAAELSRLRTDGVIGERARRRAQRRLDLREAEIGDL